MNQEEVPRTQIQVEQRRPLWQRDPPGCIKYVLLVLLVLLLLGEIAAGEFRGFPDVSTTTWIILVIKLLLIAGLLNLIRVQRSLECKLTEPSGCTEEEPNLAAGKLMVDVRGTASGGGFGKYILEVRRVGYTTPYDVVSYPGGGSFGAVPVVNGLLGRIDTTGLSDASYEVTLLVYAAWGGNPCTKKIVFTLLKTAVYINRLADVPTDPNFVDPAAELRVSGDIVAVGYHMTIHGAAYIFECEKRKIKKYEIRYAKVAAPGGEHAQPAKGDPIPGAFVSSIVLLEYSTPDHYQPWNKVGIAPRNLINGWKTWTIGASTYFKLNPGTWNSVPVGSGRFSLLLTATDTTVVTYHDIPHIWLDNHPILANLVKFQWKNPKTDAWEDIPKCMDLSLKSHGTVRILGLAWDPVIDEAWWPAVSPNDNFGHYRLDYWKQFGPSKELQGDTAQRVPALPAAPPVPVPTDADADVLAEWDLTTLDAGAGSGNAPDSKLYRGEACTFTLQLFVTDTTIIPGSGGPHHQKWDFESVKIVNDL